MPRTQWEERAHEAGAPVLHGVVGEVAGRVSKVQIAVWHLHRFTRHFIKWVIPGGGSLQPVYVGF